MNAPHIEAFADEMDKRLKGRFGGRKRYAYSMPGANVEARNRTVDLLLRYPVGPNKRFVGDRPLVIARMYFTERRVGHGTWLLRELVELAGEHGYGCVAVESAAASDGIQSFVRKFGFSEVSESPSDWIISVTELAERLSCQTDRADADLSDAKARAMVRA